MRRLLYKAEVVLTFSMGWPTNVWMKRILRWQTRNNDDCGGSTRLSGSVQSNLQSWENI